jgi:hypothetical protein
LGDGGSVEERTPKEGVVQPALYSMEDVRFVCPPTILPCASVDPIVAGAVARVEAWVVITAAVQVVPSDRVDETIPAWPSEDAIASRRRPEYSSLVSASTKPHEVISSAVECGVGPEPAVDPIVRSSPIQCVAKASAA